MIKDNADIERKSVSAENSKMEPREERKIMEEKSEDEKSNEEIKDENEPNKKPDIASCLSDIKKCEYSTKDNEIDGLYFDYIDHRDIEDYVFLLKILL